MGRTRVRGLTSLAVVLLAASSALAQDAYYAASNAGFSGAESSAQPGGVLSNAGIDRLMDINASHHSVLRSEMSSSEESPDEANLTSAPIGAIDGTNGLGRGVIVIVGIGAALAMGVGLCFASMMSGRQRTINTFAKGVVRIR